MTFLAGAYTLVFFAILVWGMGSLFAKTTATDAAGEDMDDQLSMIEAMERRDALLEAQGGIIRPAPRCIPRHSRPG